MVLQWHFPFGFAVLLGMPFVIGFYTLKKTEL